MTHDTQTREALVEVIARAICKVNEVSDDVFTEQPLHNRWIEDATAALLALEGAGVRLVPSTLTKDMCHACMTSDQAAIGTDWTDYHAVLHRRYTAQLSASPYKAKDAL